MRKRVLIAFLTLLAFGVSPSLVLAGGPTAHPPVCVAKPDVQSGPYFECGDDGLAPPPYIVIQLPNGTVITPTR